MGGVAVRWYHPLSSCLHVHLGFGSGLVGPGDLARWWWWSRVEILGLPVWMGEVLFVFLALRGLLGAV